MVHPVVMRGMVHPMVPGRWEGCTLWYPEGGRGAPCCTTRVYHGGYTPCCTCSQYTPCGTPSMPPV